MITLHFLPDIPAGSSPASLKRSRMAVASRSSPRMLALESLPNLSHPKASCGGVNDPKTSAALLRGRRLGDGSDVEA